MARPNAPTTVRAKKGAARPSVPTNVIAVSGLPLKVNLSWSASADALYVVGYRIYRWTDASPTPVRIASTPSLSYVNTGVTPDTTYYYSVSAYNQAGGESGQSATVSAVAIASAGATVSWTAPTLNTDGTPIPSTGGDALYQYRVAWYRNGHFVQSERVNHEAGVTQYSLGVYNLSPGSYEFFVTAITVDGDEGMPASLGTKVIT